MFLKRCWCPCMCFPLLLKSFQMETVLINLLCFILLASNAGCSFPCHSRPCCFYAGFIKRSYHLCNLCHWFNQKGNKTDSLQHQKWFNNRFQWSKIFPNCCKLTKCQELSNLRHWFFFNCYCYESLMLWIKKWHVIFLGQPQPKGGDEQDRNSCVCLQIWRTTCCHNVKTQIDR